MIDSFLVVLWIIWVGWMIMGLAAAISVAWFGLATKKQDQVYSTVKREDEKKVVLIISVKGFDPNNSPQFFESILTQDYRDYRVIITMESEEEPVVNWLRGQLEIPEGGTKWRPDLATFGLREIVMVYAGESKDCGQKVYNQLRAFEEIQVGDAIVAFADADIQCKKDWLSKLAAPINLGINEASTTYRWLTPRRHSFVNLFASVINASIATQAGREFSNMLWGGSMAVSRAVFESLKVPKLFKGSVNDDLRLAKAYRVEGGNISLVRSLMMPSPVNFTWSSFFEFGRRQYFQVRHFSPILYRCAFGVYTLYVLAFFTAIGAVVMGYMPAWIPILVVAFSDQLRAIFRLRIIRQLFDEKVQRILEDTSFVEHLLTPFWMTLHWLMIVSARIISQIKWAGIEYEVKGPSETRVLSRPRR